LLLVIGIAKPRPILNGLFEVGLNIGAAHAYRIQFG